MNNTKLLFSIAQSTLRQPKKVALGLMIILALASTQALGVVRAQPKTEGHLQTSVTTPVTAKASTELQIRRLKNILTTQKYSDGRIIDKLDLLNNELRGER